MSFDSTIYTIGTALSRAHDNHVTVELLVEGHWVHGRVTAIDGHGVVLADETSEQVVRMERVSAVRVMAVAPTEYDWAGGQQATPGSASSGATAAVAAWHQPRTDARSDRSGHLRPV